MTVTVSIPTILRTHTGGEKRVSAAGDTLQAVISDLEANYSGITERIDRRGKLHRFVNIYVNDEDVRFSGGLRHRDLRRGLGHDPARRRGRVSRWHDAVRLAAGGARQHAARGAAAAVAALG